MKLGKGLSTVNTRLQMSIILYVNIVYPLEIDITHSGIGSGPQLGVGVKQQVDDGVGVGYTIHSS